MKSFQLKGASSPDPTGAMPCRTSLGTLPPDPHYRLALHALAIVPPWQWQILDPPLKQMSALVALTLSRIASSIIIGHVI